MDYRSKLRLFGLPLVTVRIGPQPDGALRGIARGWIALGDVAIGVLFRAGGAAVGAIAIGGVSLGLLSVGGLAIGLLAFGGGALGVWAAGGAAAAAQAALGGLAVAMDYALGGVAIAAHANDTAARAFFDGNVFFQAAHMLAQDAQWLLVLLIVPVLFQLYKRRR
ncbi:MAG: hypothetical protein HY525_03635 [Betaproteobacteria bacterium]|nr:hypothetical protein [Betaproteobacteria bacterium]